MSEKQESEQLNNLKKLMEVAGLDTRKYAISIKKDAGREPLPPTVMVFQAFSKIAAAELTPAACKVLLFFLSQMEYQNVVSMDQFTIATRIHMTDRTVSSAIKTLTEKGIVTAVPMLNDRRRNEYFLNPYSSWKGSAKQRHDAISEIDPAQLMMFGRSAEQLKENEQHQMEMNKMGNKKMEALKKKNQ
jgi:DNA-binding transcriptional ArsR family regulator